MTTKFITRFYYEHNGLQTLEGVETKPKILIHLNLCMDIVIYNSIPRLPNFIKTVI